MLTAAVGILSDVDVCGPDWMSLVLTQLREFRYRLKRAQLTSLSLATWGHDSRGTARCFQRVSMCSSRANAASRVDAG